jgi:Ca2+-binding RTX toxin-like protein
MDGTTDITDTVASVTDNGDGSYTVITHQLADGTHDFSATVTDDAGNVSSASVLSGVVVDTVAPTVVITSVGDSGVITENETNTYHTITGTAEPNRAVDLSFPTDDDPMVNHVVTVTADGAGDWSYTLSNADMIAIGQGVSRSVTASQTDVAGNTGSSAVASFEMYTETRITSDGVVDESQLSANLGVEDSVEGGTVITGNAGNLDATDDVMDLSATSNDVTYQGAFGEVWVDDGTTVKKAYIDPTGDFEEILTGSGDDLLIGFDGVSEVFNPGAGDNTVIAGDSAGVFDVLDYSQLSGSAGLITTAAATNVADGKEFTLGTGWNSKDLIVLNLGNGQSFAAATSQYATLALLVAALESQIEAVAGDLVSSTFNDVTNTVTLTANAGASQADAIAILQASEVVVGDAGGIYGDLNPVASVNVHAAYTGSSGKIVRSDGGLDEVLGIEGVLGTAYEDILVGDDLTSYLAGGAGDDILAGQGGADTLLGEAGDDYIYGGAGDDRIIGGAGIDQLFGGAGRDVYVVDSGSVDTIRDFGVSSILSSQAGRGGVNDQVEFSVTDADITAALGSVPGTVNLSLSLVKITEYQYTLALQTTDTSPATTLATVDLDWGTVEGLFGSLDPNDYDLNAFLPAGGVLNTGAGSYSVMSTLEFVREAQVDDAAGSQVLVGQGTSDDIFVSTQGDDVVIGGLGEDTYETRILGVTSGSAINNGTETLNDLGGVGEVDTIFFEGVRDLGDLVFDRVALRREGDGRSLEIQYEQYRGVDDPDTVADETGVLHATGKVEVFNQFSLSQSDLYAIEGLEIARETDNPLDAAVQRYVFGEVSESAESGDIVSASANEDTILIGTQGKTDEYRITAPTDNSGHTEAWIYGMSDGTNLDANEDLIIELNGSSEPTLSSTDVTQVTLEGGDVVQKVSITFDQGDGAGGNDAILDLFFADGGNVNSTDLIDRIKFES